MNQHSKCDVLKISCKQFLNYSNISVYFPLDQRTKLITIQIHLSSTLTPANWDIQATQLECGVTTATNLSVLPDEADEEDEPTDSIRTRSTAIRDAPLIGKIQ